MLKIGWAERDMTPDRPAMLQGQMGERVATRARDPLTVTCLAIEGDEASNSGAMNAALLISCDIALVPEEMQEMVRARLRHSLPEVPADALLMNATHTHTSLVFSDEFYPHPGGEVMTPRECLELVVERAAECAEAAWRARRPHTLRRAFGHAVVGHNRRAVYRDGSGQMYGSTNRPDFLSFEGYEDHSLDMIFTHSEDDKLSGVLVNVPCPSQVDEALTEEFSADYWHEVRVELRRRFGPDLHVLGQCGAAGDISPHFLLYGRQEEEMRERRGLTECQEVGRRIANAVEEAAPLAIPLSTTFEHRVERLELPPRQITRQERDWAEVTRRNWLDSGGAEDGWWPQRQGQVVDQFEGRWTPPPVAVEVHSLRLGDLLLISNPFELFLDYGLRMKAQSPAAQTVVLQLAGGIGWYLPTQKAVEGGGYSAIPAVCLCGPDGGDRLVEESLRLMNSIFEPEAIRPPGFS